MDVVVPLVFPDYKIAVEVQKIKVDVLPWTDRDNFTIPAFKEKVSNLGHAGVLFINGQTGVTKYYEYGRYDPPKEPRPRGQSAEFAGREDRQGSSRFRLTQEATRLHFENIRAVRPDSGRIHRGKG
jgi:hypothetical protein